MKNWKKYLVAALIAVGLFGGGYYSGRISKPTETRHEEVVKVEEKKETKTDTDTKVKVEVEEKKQNNIVKHKRTVKETDGKVVMDEWEWDSSNSEFKLTLDIDEHKKEETSTETKVETRVVTIEKRDGPVHWGVHAGYDVIDLAQDLDFKKLEVSVHGSYRFLGPVAAYAEVEAPVTDLAATKAFVGLSVGF